MKCFKLKTNLQIIDVELGKRIYTKMYPYVYLDANGIFFSDILTENPIEAFKSSVPQLYYNGLSEASTVYFSIKRGAEEGYRRICIDVRGGNLSIQFAKEDMAASRSQHCQQYQHYHS